MIVKFFKKTFLFSLLVLSISCNTEDDETLITLNSAEEINYSAKTITNLALDKTTEQSSTAYSGISSRAVDGNTSGSWSEGSVTHTSSEENAWWQVRLGAEYQLGEITIWGRTDNCCADRLSNFDVFIYDDERNLNYKTTVESLSNGSITIDAEGAIGSRVRIKLKDANPLSLAEVQVFESEEIESTTTTTTSSGIVDFGNLTVETSWISEDKDDRDSFEASTVDGEDWMDVYSSGIVIMKCLAADGHRTELKEDSGDEAPLTTYKNMLYTATLTSIPSHGVTIAQIHNRGGVKRPWIRVYVDADRYIKIKATATTPDEDTSTYDDVYVGPKYTSGDEFSIEITTDNGNASFEISTNGETYAETLTPSSDWDAFSNDYYLKAGVYTEGEDTQPQIKFSAFSLEY